LSLKIFKEKFEQIFFNKKFSEKFKRKKSQKICPVRSPIKTLPPKRGS